MIHEDDPNLLSPIPSRRQLTDRVSRADSMRVVGQDVITFASVILAAAIAYLTAMAAWKRQQRREVYGAFIAAVDDALEWLDLLLDHAPDARIGDLDEWKEFRQARHRFDVAWGQVRLVAPGNLAEHAGRTGYELLTFDRSARSWTVEQAQAWRQDSLFLHWGPAEAFVTAARRDLRVEPRIPVLRTRTRTVPRMTQTELDPQEPAAGPPG